MLIIVTTADTIEIKSEVRLVDNIIIVSDDLTGANDSGVQFAKHGIPTVVCIDDCQLPDPASEGTACVINVESRSLSPEEAYRKWGRLLESIDLSSYQIVFKKNRFHFARQCR